MTNTADNSFLQFLPVSLFGGILALASESGVWGYADKFWGVGMLLKHFFAALTVVLFVLLAITYITKWIRYPGLVKSELRHPVSLSLFGTIPGAMTLVSGVILPYDPPLAVGLWMVSAAVTAILVVYALRTWFGSPQDPGNAMPAWLMPIAAMLDVPLVGQEMPVKGNKEIDIIFFSVGFLTGMILLIIILSRLLFREALPGPLQPTLMILAAPFALCYLDYFPFAAGNDISSNVFFYGALLMVVVFGSKVVHLLSGCPFRVTWWAVSFPLGATTTAIFHFADHNPDPIYHWLAAAMLVVFTAVIVFLLANTAIKIYTHQFFLKDPTAERAVKQLKPIPEV